MSSSYTVHFAVKEGLSMVMSGDYPQRFARALQVRLISQSTFEFEQRNLARRLAKCSEHAGWLAQAQVACSAP
jgi:hypothetical protein